MLDQLPLFYETFPLAVPPVIHEALREGAALAVGVSGGKDSQALLEELVRWFRAQGYPGELIAVHAHLGRAEWPQTLALIEALCRRLNVELVITRRAKGDLLDRIDERMAQVAGTGKPFWPSKQQRYCTSDLKREPIDKVLRRYPLVVSAEGVRGAESDERAAKNVVDVRKSITASSKEEARNLRTLTPERALAGRGLRQRVAFDWRPLFHWSEGQVWQSCGTSGNELVHRRRLWQLGQRHAALLGWPAHPAYVMGNRRLSCAFCIMGSIGDLTNAANQNPVLYGEYLKRERRGGSRFQANLSLTQLRVTGEAAQVRAAYLDVPIQTIPAHGQQTGVPLPI